jgi:flagellar basal-body rod modification protein FlgD
MSTVAPTTASSLQSLAATSSTSPAATNTIGADFNMFLKLLTTQMQNQDPLSPMDSAQYTQQLVQYSQVEQTVQQSGTLKEILASLSNQNMAQASGYIGRVAEFSSAVSGLGATPASWTYSADVPLASGTVSITNAAGTVVDSRSVSLSGTGGSFSWDGTLADGSIAPSGAYTLSLSALNAAGAAVPVTIHSVGTVGGVTAKNGVLSLGVNGVPMSIESLVSLAAAG